jgi:hypothetical protein
MVIIRPIFSPFDPASGVAPLPRLRQNGDKRQNAIGAADQAAVAIRIDGVSNVANLPKAEKMPEEDC